MHIRQEHLLLQLARRHRMTWGGVEAFVGRSGRMQLMDDGMIRQHPDYSGLAVLDDAGRQWVAAARDNGYTVDAYR